MAKTYRCSLVTPDQQVLDDEVTYASFPQWDGMRGIAPGHAAMVAKLGDGILRLDFPQGGKTHFYISGGFVQMKGDNLSLMTTECIPAESVVKQEIIDQLHKAQAMEATTTAQAEEKTRLLNRSRMMLQMLEEFGNKL